LLHESAPVVTGGGAPPLFPPRPLPRPRFAEPRRLCTEGLINPSGEVAASVDGADCDGGGREEGCFASRRRIVGAGKTPGRGCGGAGAEVWAALPLAARASSSFSLLLPPSLFSLWGPSLAGPFSLSFSCARSRLPPPPLETPAPLRAASKCLDAIPSTGRCRLPEPSELTGASTGEGEGAVTPASALALAPLAPAPVSVLGDGGTAGTD